MAGGGGQGGMLGGMIERINQAEQIGRSAASGVPGYVAPSQLTQAPMYQAPQAAPQISPLAQQMMMRSMAPQPIMGLPAALMQMQGRLNQPMMRGPMPQYGSQGNPMAYRPDMTQAQARLNSVAKSVILQQKEAAEAELARMKEAEEERQRQNDYGGGG